MKAVIERSGKGVDIDDILKRYSDSVILQAILLIYGDFRDKKGNGITIREIYGEE